MSEQRTDAAERSAHVERGPVKGEIILPVVEISPGVWKLRRVVELEAENERLRAERDDLRRLLVGVGAGIPAAAILKAEDRTDV